MGSSPITRSNFLKCRTGHFSPSFGTLRVEEDKWPVQFSEYGIRNEWERFPPFHYPKYAHSDFNEEMNLSFILIFTCLVIGALLRRSGRLPENAAKSFNAFVIWVSLPSVVLLQVPSLVETLRSSEGVRAMDLAGLVAMPWLLFAGSFFLFRAIGKRLGWARTEIGALILTAGLGNTAFIGYPLIDAFFGREGVRLAVLTDQPGTFLVVSILGLILATLYSPGAGRTVSARRIFRSVATFPPFVALLIALAWALSGNLFPDRRAGTALRTHLLYARPARAGFGRFSAARFAGPPPPAVYTGRIRTLFQADLCSLSFSFYSTDTRSDFPPSRSR